MPNRSLSILDLMPGDFAAAPYEAIHRRMDTKKDTHPDSWAQYAGAWNAIVYRFRSCADHDRAFTKSVKRSGSAPPQPGRYIQERELFDFFMNGLAAIESFCYGLFVIASIVDAQNFPIRTPADMRSINPENTARQFATAFPAELITTALQQMLNEQNFKDWKEIRNILVHRAAPGRTILLSTRRTLNDLWLKGIPINRNTTASRRQWLAGTLNSLLVAAEVFATQKF